MSALDRLREEMAETVRRWQFTDTAGDWVEVSAVVDVLIEGWRVEMKMIPATRERFYVITTPRRPASALEKLMDQAQDARLEWLRNGDEAVPPPPSVTTLDLLNQRVWWITGDKNAVRLDDMSPAHRVNLLRFLRRNAMGYQTSEWMSGLFDHAPDEVVDMAVEEDPERWLGRQELVRRLKKLIRRDRRHGYEHEDGPALDEGRLVAYERFPDD